MALRGHDLALLTARFGAARFGASRFGFIPCPEDVEGAGADEPGEYVWREQTPASELVETEWTLQAEDCVCRNLCTLDLSAIEFSDSTPTTNQDITATVTLSGVLGRVSGIARIDWGDGRHEQQDFDTLEDGDIVFEPPHGHYHAAGTYAVTITVTDERGCSASQTRPITVEEAPSFVASFTWSKDPETGVVDFTNTTVGADTFSWDFDEGDPPDTNENPTNDFDDLYIGDPDDVHNYTVVLTASGPGGSDQATANLSISYNADGSGSGS